MLYAVCKKESISSNAEQHFIIGVITDFPPNSVRAANHTLTVNITFSKKIYFI
jgi:hypothetical protein